jgi:hypothetical protein
MIYSLLPLASSSNEIHQDILLENFDEKFKEKDDRLQ